MSVFYTLVGEPFMSVFCLPLCSVSFVWHLVAHVDCGFWRFICFCVSLRHDCGQSSICQSISHVSQETIACVIVNPVSVMFIVEQQS